jgi:tRNA U34 5-carboxymethylaminomethyl modifying GTPase MnmE/TrmE
MVMEPELRRTVELVNPQERSTTMSAVEELEVLQRQIARLRQRVEHQAMHVEGLAAYPELATRAGKILEQVTENLRLALIQLAEIRAQVDREATQVTKGPLTHKSDVA